MPIFMLVKMLNEKKSQDQRISTIVLLCFFLSGSLGLIYEIIWIRKLGLIFGTTVFAISTVLAAFFGGLALGSLLFGKLASRFSNPVKAYALLEFAVSVFALLFPVILNLFGWLYTIFYPHIYSSFSFLTLTRFLLFALLLIFPTTMMGGTLPILSQYFVRSTEDMGKKLGILYALNTFGAAIGACLCGFYFIHTLGVDTTNYLAGIANIVVASFAYLAGSRLNLIPASTKDVSNVPGLVRKVRNLAGAIHASPLHSTKEESQASDPMLRYIIVCFFLSGFASIGYEVAWTRYLSLPLANTRYTYTIILTVFLSGIAIGSMIFARFFDKVKNRVRFFGCLEIGIGFSAFILVPIVYLLATKVEYSLFLSDFLTCGILMLIPTIFMGATFPIVVKIMTANASSIGHSTGRLYAINTLGCILGSITTGFLLIPVLGIRLSLNVLVGINILIGFFCLFKDAKRKWAFNAIITVVTVLAFLISHISLKVQIPKDFLTILKKPSEKITLVKEGLENTVWMTVNQQNQQKSIWANQTVLGRTRAKEPYGISPQIIAGHIPVLLHRGSPKEILAICLGTGQTFGSILSYDIEKIDVVEISKTIADIALEEFKDYNGDIGMDERATIIVEDGRNFVAHTRNMYDIITLEPSPPEEAGIVNLYTQEFYQSSKRRLNKDGIMSQWLPIYNTHPDETARIIRTFISVFPDSILWYNGADLVLLGFNGRIQIGINEIESLLQNKKISSDLGVSYLGDQEYNLNEVQNLLAGFLMGPEELQKFSNSAAPITDNHPDLEYTFLKYETLENKPEWLTIYNSEKIEHHLTPLQPYFPSIPKDRIEKMEEIRSKYVSHLYAEAYNRLAVAKAKEDLEAAIAFCKKALEHNSSYGIAYSNLGAYYYEQGKASEAISAYEKAVQLLPDVPELWHASGRAHWSAGRSDEAIEAWHRAVNIKPDFAEAYNDLGVAYTIARQYQNAIEAYKKAIGAKPDCADTYYNLGLVYERTSQWANAIAMYKEAIRINPDFTEALARLKSIAR